MMAFAARIPKLGIGALLTATLTSACARPSIAPFSELDRNGDGRISHKEAARDVVLHRQFSNLDMDEDGELSPFEYLQAGLRRR